MNRTLLAFAVAPLWTPVVVDIGLAKLWLPGSPPASHLLFATVSSLCIGYLFTVVVGWPLLRFAGRRAALFVPLAMLACLIVWSLIDIGFTLTIDDTDLEIALRALWLEYAEYPSYLVAPLVLGGLIGGTIRGIARRTRGPEGAGVEERVGQ
jgi:GAF domain-containing protein